MAINQDTLLFEHRFCWITLTLLTSLLVVNLAFATPQSQKPLQVIFVDVEGGQSTLFVTPTGDSLLIDTGWAGNESRDAKRIAAAAHQAGLKKIDYVLITHYHLDHVGGVPQLVKEIPVGTFIDHGQNREMSGDTLKVWQAYQAELATGKYKHLTVHPGDILPVKGVDATVVSGDGNLISKPLPGAGEQNAACKSSEQRAADQTENARSLGIVMMFGKLKIVDLGDLTWDKEMQLMCPVNKLGRADIYIVSHHGWYQSGSPALVDGLSPRVAIMDNGARKGGTPSAWDIIHQSPGLEDLWQLHYSEEGGAAHNAPDSFLANINGPDQGNYLKLSAWPDGHFEIFNSRTGTTKQYDAR
ncbi:MAG TPA: MBL fold metallo-hydrolase [Terriglobales bacterium]|jgi:beta-lactamase superfamily II metal-dependent hydrolase|nr:MBL fold metallo-hydrolase [Terriglobales bacterium]